MAAARKDRISTINDPRQRAVARHMQEIEDVFSTEFARLDPASRCLAVEGKAATDAERWRNLVRMPMIGFAVRLGIDLGLPVRSLFGCGEGRTEIVELQGLHYGTILKAVALFDAILEDKSEVAMFIANRYRQIFRKALAEVEGGDQGKRAA